MDSLKNPKRILLLHYLYAIIYFGKMIEHKLCTIIRQNNVIHLGLAAVAMVGLEVPRTNTRRL